MRANTRQSVLASVMSTRVVIGDCWEPTIYARDHGGYVRAPLQGRRIGVHRLAYEEFNGAIPPGMTVDHLCFNPACFNPAHLRLLSNEANAGRQQAALADRCKKGHEYTPANTYDLTAIRRNAGKSGRRSCRRCNSAAVVRYKARRRATEAAS